MNLEEHKVLKLIDYGVTKICTDFILLDKDGNEHKIRFPHIWITKEKYITAKLLLLYMYDVKDISQIGFVNGVFLDNELIDILHVMNNESLMSIISIFNSYNDRIYSAILKEEKTKPMMIIQSFKTNRLLIYKTSFTLQITRLKRKNDIINIDINDMDLLKYTIRREWRFAKDKNWQGPYFVNGRYKNKSNPNNVGGNHQIWFDEYCYNTSHKNVKFVEIEKNHYKLETNLPAVDINTFIAIDEKINKEYFKHKLEYSKV